MPTIYRRFEVVFSKDEIKEILAERAKQIIRARKDGGKGFVLYDVKDVECQVTVKLYVEEKDGK
jgi:hypothetical protein